MFSRLQPFPSGEETHAEPFRLPRALKIVQLPGSYLQKHIEDGRKTRPGVAAPAYGAVLVTWRGLATDNGSPKVHQLVRTSVAAAGLVAVLALTGCSSDSDGGGDAGKDTSSSAPTEAGSTGGGGSGEDAKGESLEGTWAGTTDGKIVALSVTGTTAGVIADGHACTGTLQDHDGEQMLSLKCADGSKDRTMGSIESNDGKTLVVSWEGGAKDTLKKSDPGAMPSGLPEGLPTP